MIERVYLKDNLSFKEVELNFKNGLIVFSGASGAGKSVLFDSILALFGLKESSAQTLEATLNEKIDLGEYGLENDDILIFKAIKKEKLRYFINAQSISKKNITVIASKFIKFLSLKDFSDFSNSSLLNTIDEFIKSSDNKYIKLLDNFNTTYTQFNLIKKELSQLQDKEQKIEELKEFVNYEIQKIESINPDIDEYEKLSHIKKDISKKDKILQAVSKAETIFEYENNVNDVYRLVESNSTLFEEAMNEARELFENEKNRLESLEDINIEEVLDRIEALSTLIKKYGSITEALDYLNQKKEELKGYENISYEKSKVQKQYISLQNSTINLATDISKQRLNALKVYEKFVNNFIKDLQLSDLTINLNRVDLNSFGYDSVEIKLNNIALKNLSSGEFNRVRLAMIATRSKIQNSSGILILDEIDANLSGVESQSVAKVLKELSKNYQIFSISHQPQLSASASQHFLVSKIDGVSSVSELNNTQRIKEIARMISGENITQDALNFATGVLNDN